MYGSIVPGPVPIVRGSIPVLAHMERLSRRRSPLSPDWGRLSPDTSQLPRYASPLSEGMGQLSPTSSRLSRALPGCRDIPDSCPSFDSGCPRAGPNCPGRRDNAPLIRPNGSEPAANRFSARKTVSTVILAPLISSGRQVITARVGDDCLEVCRHAEQHRSQVGDFPDLCVVMAGVEGVMGL